MPRIKITITAVVEYETDPDEDELTPQEVLDSTIRYADDYTMEFLDHVDPTWTVTGEIVTPATQA
jgi:hypothetical protein